MNELDATEPARPRRAGPPRRRSSPRPPAARHDPQAQGDRDPRPRRRDRALPARRHQGRDGAARRLERERTDLLMRAGTQLGVPARRGHARGDDQPDDARPPPKPPASAAPSCAACSTRSAASTRPTASSCGRSSPSWTTSSGSSARGAGGYAPPGVPRPRIRPPDPPPRPEPAGLTMSADLHLLRTADLAARSARAAARPRRHGHNIANAHTEGYTRQEAVLGATDAVQVTDGALASGAGRAARPGVDVQSYRADARLVPRSPVPRAEHGAGRADDHGRSPVQVETCSASRATTASPRSWASSGARGATLQRAGEPGQPPGAGRTGQDGRQLDPVRLLRPLAGRLGRDLRIQLADRLADREIAQDAAELGSLNAAIKKAVASGDHPNDLQDRRDQVLDDLSQYGQVSVTDLGNGSLDVAFGDAANPLVDGHHRQLAAVDQQRRPAGHHRGRQARRALDLFKTGGTIACCSPT